MDERPLQCGLITPIASFLPGTPAWEETAGPEELATIARAADAFGYAYLTCSEHVGIPPEEIAARGPRFYDPLATLSFIAALTTRIRVLTHVVVLPYHHPLALAKQYGTLDRLSNGRLILGVGVGSLAREFAVLGVDFEGRGPRYEEALAALRTALGNREPEFAGAHYRFGGLVIDPCAVQQRVPIWLGGRTPRSLRRAFALGDGWVPFGLGLDDVRALLAKQRETPAWQERAAPFDVALPVECPVDAAMPARLGALVDRIAQTRAAGATIVSLTVRARSAAHYVEQLDLLKGKVMSAT